MKVLFFLSLSRSYRRIVEDADPRKRRHRKELRQVEACERTAVDRRGEVVHVSVVVVVDVLTHRVAAVHNHRPQFSFSIFHTLTTPNTTTATTLTHTITTTTTTTTITDPEALHNVIVVGPNEGELEREVARHVLENVCVVSECVSVSVWCEKRKEENLEHRDAFWRLEKAHNYHAFHILSE